MTTPLSNADELSEHLRLRVNQYGETIFILDGSEYRLSTAGAIDLLQLITAYTEKVAVKARIDELENLGYTYYSVCDRIDELEAELQTPKPQGANHGW